MSFVNIINQCCFRLKFPSILLLFFVVDVFIAGKLKYSQLINTQPWHVNFLPTAMLVLIAAVDRNTLLCSSINLIEAINSPTVFCSISGNA